MKLHVNFSRTRGAGGQVAIIVVVALIVLLSMTGLAVDVGSAYSVKTGQESTLESIRQSALGMANAVKYSENPGREAREQVIELLQDNGYTGTAEVWYAELSADKSGASDRYCGVYVKLSDESKTAFLSIVGKPSLDVASQAVWTLHPYSTGTVFRPSDVGNGSVTCTFEDGRVTGRKEASTRYEDAPKDLTKAITDAAATKGSSSDNGE